MRQKIKKASVHLLRIVGIVHLVLAVLVFFACVVIHFVNPPVYSLMLYRKWAFGYPIEQVRTVRLDQVPRDLLGMVLALEDSKFFQHFGIDPSAIGEAFWNNLRMGKRFFGASTIDQQLARTLFLYPKKSFVRKYLEAFIALEMDLFLTKERILELYLNSIEWGRGVFGIQSASYHYYGKGVEELTKDEMMRLVTILPSPVKYNPTNFTRLRIMNMRYETLKGYDLTNQLKMGITNGILEDVTNLLPGTPPALSPDLPDPEEPVHPEAAGDPRTELPDPDGLTNGPDQLPADPSPFPESVNP